MSLDAATTATQSAVTFQGVVGFGSTGQETTRTIVPMRPVLLTSGTLQRLIGAPAPGIPAAQRIGAYVQHLLSTEDADVAAVRWDELHGQLFFHSPILVGSALAVGLASSFSPQYELRTRMLTLPIRWRLGAVLETHTRETPESWESTVTLSSTDPIITKPDYLRNRVSELFASAAEENFEEGTESPFAKGLLALIRDYGNAAVAALESTLEPGRTDIEVAREVLRWLGAIDHSQSGRYRRAVLEKHLKASSARLRYAAGLGLAEMDDPAAIPALIAAIRTEAHDKIRWHFQLVLDQLEDTRRWLSS